MEENAMRTTAGGGAAEEADVEAQPPQAQPPQAQPQDECGGLQDESDDDEDEDDDDEDDDDEDDDDEDDDGDSCDGKGKAGNMGSNSTDEEDDDEDEFGGLPEPPPMPSGAGLLGLTICIYVDAPTLSYPEGVAMRLGTVVAYDAGPPPLHRVSFGGWASWGQPSQPSAWLLLPAGGGWDSDDPNGSRSE